jgi:hypothetical protein
MTATTRSGKIHVASARDLGTLFARNQHEMIGQDGAFSIPVSREYTLWFFGDTLIGRRVPGASLWYNGTEPVGHADMSGRGAIRRMINNTGLLLRHHSGADAMDDFEYLCDEDHQLRALIPLENDEHPDWDRIWCQHGICLGRQVVLSFIKVKMLNAPGPFPVNFEIVGSGLARGSTADWRFARVTRNAKSVLWPATEPHFATAFLAVDDWIYLYGTVKRGETHQAYLARVGAGCVDQIEQYQYLASPGALSPKGSASAPSPSEHASAPGASRPPKWSNKVADAVPLFDGMPSEMSVSWNKYLGAFLAVHSLDLSGKIVGRTAPSPWGPWSDPTVLWSVQVTRDKPLPYPVLVYAGKEHPELAGDSGRQIYLTYIEFEEYFPHLVEITLR